MHCITRYKPDLWCNVETLFDVYKDHLPRMRKRSCLSSLQYEESLYAVFSHAAYRFTTKDPILKINEYDLIPSLSDENSVVYSTGAQLGVTTRIVISFRGTNPLKFDDILTDLFITFGKEMETERFSVALQKVEKVMDMYPEVPIVVCGHSLGGTQAIYISKKYRFRTYAYNPAQGISLHYLNEINKHPQIRVFRVLSDPISCIAGLENVSGTVLFPSVSVNNMMKNHSLMNFLPHSNIPPVFNM
jgi:hypothetical protein